MLTPDFIPHL